MITQCSIRHLYLLDGTTHPNKSRLIDTAKTFERRKCGHHELDEPLPEKECFDSVVNIKGENKHRYCVAAQDHEIRKSMREIPGVPSIAINRSVMILEPMTDASVFRRDNMERKKFREGIMDARAAVHGVQEVKKRKRGPNDEADGDGEEGDGDGEKEKEKKKKKKRKGPPGPNPLSVKKKKPKAPQQGQKSSGEAPAAAAADGNNEAAKKRRKRKHGKGADGEQQSAAGPAE